MMRSTAAGVFVALLAFAGVCVVLFAFQQIIVSDAPINDAGNQIAQEGLRQRGQQYSDPLDVAESQKTKDRLRWTGMRLSDLNRYHAYVYLAFGVICMLPLAIVAFRKRH